MNKTNKNKNNTGKVKSNNLDNETKDTTKPISNDETEVLDQKENKIVSKTEKIEKIEKELENAKDEKLRLLAEMENLRKRSEKEKIESIKFGSINLARDIISPCDNLLRALESLSEEEKKDEKNKSLINGLSMVYKEIITILEKNGVKKIVALNKPFDHNYHQAMMEIESDEESGIILKELQTGYTMHDRLLRPSMVAVSKKKDKDNKNK